MVSKIWLAIPSISAAVRMRARSSTWSVSSAPPPASLCAGAFAKVTSAWLRRSTSERADSVTPSPFSTRYSPSCAETTNNPAECASATNVLVPESLPLATDALPPTPVWRAPSSIAMLPTSSPEASRGRNCACCSALPPRTIALAATVVATSGLAARLLPSSSITSPAESQPKSEPPCASGMTIPAQPISRIAPQAWGSIACGSPALRTLRQALTGLSLAAHSRAMSRSIACSSLSTAMSL